MTKKILITGVAGNIGSALTKALCERDDYFVVGVDDLSTGSVRKLPTGAGTRFRFIKADANSYEDMSSIFLKFGFDYVFHFAAVVGVKRTIENPILVLKDIDGIRNVLNLSKNTGVERVFYSSSSEVYGEPVVLPQHEETTPLNSRLPYAVVKNVGESYFKSYQREYGLDYTIFRFFNTYGPDQSEDFVVPRFLRKALAGEPLTIYGDGRQTRTFCYVADNVETMVNTLEQKWCVNEVLNIGSDVEVSVLELAKIVTSQCASSSPIVHLPPLAEGDMTRRQPDNSKMLAILNRPLVPLEEGIRRMLASPQFRGSTGQSRVSDAAKSAAPA